MKKELSNYGMAAKLKLSMDKDDPDDLELTTECIKEQLLKRSHNHSLSDMDYRFYIKILWFGFIDEGYGFGSIVAFDRTTRSDQKDKYVELFHFERNEIILYDKSIVRPRLRRLTNQEKTRLPEVISVFIQVNALLEIERLAKEYSWSENELSSDEFKAKEEVRKEIFDEASDYSESCFRSENEGWFYSDTDDEY
jgi:hypothetical protein